MQAAQIFNRENKHISSHKKMFNYKNNLSETLVYFDDIKITISNLNYFFTQKILYQFGHNLFLSGYGVYISNPYVYIQTICTYIFVIYIYASLGYLQ